MLGAKVNRDDAVGIVSGLVWTPNGGEIQTVEVTLVPGKGNLMLTGQLGDVLQESAHIALSYLRARAHRFDLPPEDFENFDIHIHMPEGAVPKDGPSAGITLATALISAFTECPVRADSAMTGEITLRGQILPVGGVVEKVLASRRRAIPHIILPEDNQKDLRDVPKAVMRDISVSSLWRICKVCSTWCCRRRLPGGSAISTPTSGSATMMRARLAPVES